MQSEDFQVSVWEGSRLPVIFYLKSGLIPLAQQTFSASVQWNSPVRRYGSSENQALYCLHNPNREYRDFWCRANDVHEERGNPLLMTRLSNLLAKLQSKDHTPNLAQVCVNLDARPVTVEDSQEELGDIHRHLQREREIQERMRHLREIHRQEQQRRERE